MSRYLPASIVAFAASALLAGCCKLAGTGQESAAPTPEPTPVSVGTPDGEPTESPASPGTATASTPGVDEKLARNFYVVFDGSGSMRERSCGGKFGRKLPAAQWAFKEFLGAIAPEDHLGLLVFDRLGLREVIPIGSGNREAVERAVDSVDASLGTPLGPAIELALKALAAQQEKQLGYGEYHLVVVTDGRADDARALKQAVRKAGGAGILLHTIAFCIDAGNDLKTASYSFRTANDPEELKAAVVGVLAESEDFQSMAFEQVK